MKLLKTLPLFLVFGLLSCRPQTTGNVSPKHHKTVLIAADGVIDVEPNMASFSVSTSCEKKKMSESREGLAKGQGVLLAILKDFGIEDKNKQTGYISFRKNYKWVNNSNVFVGYVSTINTSITLRDISKIDNLYSRIFEEEILEPGSINFSHSNLDSIGEVAYQIALENANSTADKILEKVDESKKEILRIGNAGLGQVGPSGEVIENLPGETSNRKYKYVEYKNLQISKGSLQVRKNLTVEYKIK